MKYIERLLQRQAQMAARLERQSAPNLRLYPDEIWQEMPKRARVAEDDEVSATEVSQTDAAEEMYRQMTRLDAVREQSMRAVLWKQRETSALDNRNDMSTQASAETFMPNAEASVAQLQKQVFGILPESRVSQYSMERISRFFERDARRYGG